MGSNGQLTSAELAPVFTGRPARLARGGAAAAMNTLNLFLFHERPATGRYVSNGYDSDYRPVARQRYWRAYWCNRGRCGNAAVPGTSNHGWAKASDGQRWKLVLYKVFRWFGSDAPWESWHSLYLGGFARPDPGPDPRFPVLRVGSGGTGQAMHVRRLQAGLKRLGLFPADVAVSGTYGPVTRAGVLALQELSHWKNPTGVCTRAVWGNLNAALARR